MVGTGWGRGCGRVAEAGTGWAAKWRQNGQKPLTGSGGAVAAPGRTRDGYCEICTYIRIIKTHRPL